MPRELARLRPGEADAFFASHEREALKTFYAFSVIWHEQTHDVAVMEDGAIAGALRLRIAASLGHVERAIVAPEHRRRGIGRALLASAENWARTAGMHRLQLKVITHNGPAIALYESCGFVREGTLKNHLKLNTGLVDQHFMAKLLT